MGQTEFAGIAFAGNSMSNGRSFEGFIEIFNAFRNPMTIQN